MSGQPRVQAFRRRLVAGHVGRWLTTAVSMLLVLSIGVLTLPEPSGVVSAPVDRGFPPGPPTIARPTAEDQPATRAPDFAAARSGHHSSPSTYPRAEALPASISVDGSATQIRVVAVPASAGVLQAPDDPSVVGWWTSGARPGAPGRVVITGRLNSPAGAGAGAQLSSLTTGDRIQLTGADGRIQHYRVTDRRELARTRLDTSMFTHTTDGPDLLLVTCAGQFDTTDNSYVSSVVISAGEVDG